MIKRTIGEWITVARISRDVAHIFFEGPSDARVIAHASGYPPGIDFRSADEVESEEGQSKNPLISGNKLRLIVLAKKSSVNNCDNIRCFVDGDFSLLVSHLLKSSCLFETEYANLPASTLTFRWLQGFMLKGYGFAIDENWWKFLCYTLKFAFVARFISACSQNPKKAPCASDFVVIDKGKLDFNENKYLSSYFGGDDHEISSLKTQITELIDWLECDIRRAVNSSDLFDLVYIFLKKGGKISGSTSRDAIRQAYFSAMDDNILEQDGFGLMREWMTGYAK